MKKLLNTVYVTSEGAALRKDGENLVAEVEGAERSRVPLHMLSAVVVFGAIHVSPPLMAALAGAGITLTFLDRNGRFQARLEGPVSGNVLLRQAQYRLAGEPDFALGVARNCIAGKVRNCRQVLLRGAREAKGEEDASRLARAAEDLAATVRALPMAGDLDALRGLEGEAAR